MLSRFLTCIAAAAVLASGCAAPVDPSEGPDVGVASFYLEEGDPTTEAIPEDPQLPDYVDASFIEIYKDHDAWHGKDEPVLDELGFVKGSDYGVRPTSQLQGTIPHDARVILITSNSYGWSSTANNVNHPDAQANLEAFVQGGGTLVMHLADNIWSDSFIAPGLAKGTNGPNTNTLEVADPNHPIALGPDGLAGTADDLTDANIQWNSSCCAIHGYLPPLPVDAQVVLTSNGNPVLAEYPRGAGRVIVTSMTMEFGNDEDPGVVNGYGMPRRILRNELHHATTVCDSDPKVLLAPSDTLPTALQGELQAAGIGHVDAISLVGATPDLSQLQQYDVVVTWTNYAPSDPIGWGNVLADYVDGGGKLIIATFSFYGPIFDFEGRITDPGYSPFDNVFGSPYSTSTLGSHDAGHPIMQDVGALTGYYRDDVSLDPSATLVASWADGRPFVAVNADQDIVGVTLYPGQYRRWSGDAPKIFSNAAKFLGSSCDVVGPANEPPVADAGPDQVAECLAQVTLDGSGSYDPEGDSLSYDWTIDGNPASTSESFSTSLPPGVHVAELTVSDGELSDSDSATVTVNDTQAPVVTCGADAVIALDADTCTASLSQGASASDACQGSIAVASHTFAFDAPGSESHPFSVTDAAGNVGSCTQTVTAQDVTPAVLICPADDVLVLSPVDCTASQQYAATADDACDGALQDVATVSLDAVGSTVQDYAVTDAAGNTSGCTQAVSAVDEAAPSLALGGADPQVIECAEPYVELGVSVADACDAVPTVDVLTDVDTSVPGTYTVEYVATDASGNVDSVGRSVQVVDTTPPAIVSMTGPTDPNEVGTTVSVGATFTDACGPHTGSWAWGDGSTSAAAVGDGTASGEHAYDSAGVYTATLTLQDASGNVSVESFRFIVIYDPDAGFVTGGGWIDSPAGAYVADPTLGGRANFGFVSKYKRGQSVPSGQTQFRFNAAGLSFLGDVYEWLVIAGPRAQYKGTGTLDGQGSYGFMLTARDGQAPGGGGDDLFRIKIWDTATDAVVYDNQPGEADDSDAGTSLGGGNIVIHSK